VIATPQGWTMIVVGMGVGFLFALMVLVISVVSLPPLLDRNVGVYCAVVTSVKAVRMNPGPMAVWGLIIAAGLVIGTSRSWSASPSSCPSSGMPPGISTARW
jgi:uncharacterized membrane protein